VTIEIAVIRCHSTRHMTGCGRTLSVYQGPSGLEAFCPDCGNVFRVREKKMEWGRPFLAVPKGAIMREVPA
jgi:predicted RNA-binding Zn-ribbon protein involved in translation (DUF1610 family)